MESYHMALIDYIVSFYNQNDFVYHGCYLTTFQSNRSNPLQMTKAYPQGFWSQGGLNMHNKRKEVMDGPSYQDIVKTSIHSITNVIYEIFGEDIGSIIMEYYNPKKLAIRELKLVRPELFSIREFRRKELSTHLKNERNSLKHRKRETFKRGKKIFHKERQETIQSYNKFIKQKRREGKRVWKHKNKVK